MMMHLKTQEELLEELLEEVRETRRYAKAMLESSVRAATILEDIISTRDDQSAGIESENSPAQD